MQAMEIGSAPLTPGPCVAGVSAVGRRGLGPQVQLGAVLLEAAPDSEATEGDDGKNQQLLHGGDPFTSTMSPNPGKDTDQCLLPQALRSLATDPGRSAPTHRYRTDRPIPGAAAFASDPSRRTGRAVA
ncbi:hypothetical protein GCM10009527_078280 [Actinomadura nitritigenes]